MQAGDRAMKTKSRRRSSVTFRKPRRPTAVERAGRALDRGASPDSAAHHRAQQPRVSPGSDVPAAAVRGPQPRRGPRTDRHDDHGSEHRLRADGEGVRCRPPRPTPRTFRCSAICWRRLNGSPTPGPPARGRVIVGCASRKSSTSSCGRHRGASRYGGRCPGMTEEENRRENFPSLLRTEGLVT